MKKYEFSVIVPIYNGSSYLDETLQSIFNQTIGFKDNIELILVNDGSSEEEVDTICKKYESNYKENVIYIKKENGGVSSARNEGLKHVHGKYINFFAADDKWEADAFEKVKKAFDKNEVSIVCCRQKFFDAKEGYQTLDYRFDKGNHISNIFEEPKNILLSVTNTFFKREAIENHQFNEKLKYGEDARFVIEVALETENIMFLKDAVNEALREWSRRIEDTHYLVGSVVGPHPFPVMVRDFQSVISREARKQILEIEGKLPKAVIACVGGGSNAIGAFYHFIEDKEVELIGCEAAGRGIDTIETAATLSTGRVGVFHGMKSYFCQDEAGQIAPVYSISAGLDYPGVGPEHSYLYDIKRAKYVAVTDDEAVDGFQYLSKTEGIIPAIESAHAVAYAKKIVPSLSKDDVVIINISGRGDKDVAAIARYMGVDIHE